MSAFDKGVIMNIHALALSRSHVHIFFLNTFIKGKSKYSIHLQTFYVFEMASLWHLHTILFITLRFLRTCQLCHLHGTDSVFIFVILVPHFVFVWMRVKICILINTYDAKIHFAISIVSKPKSYHFEIENAKNSISKITLAKYDANLRFCLCESTNKKQQIRILNTHTFASHSHSHTCTCINHLISLALVFSCFPHSRLVLRMSEKIACLEIAKPNFLADEFSLEPSKMFSEGRNGMLPNIMEFYGFKWKCRANIDFDVNATAFHGICWRCAIPSHQFIIIEISLISA